MNNEVVYKPFAVAIPTADGTAVAKYVTVENVPMKWNENVKDWVILSEGLDMIEDAKAHEMGLLLPSELRSLRLRLKLTQPEISDLLQIGAKTWSRWENGKGYPSRSINLLIRALSDNLLTERDFEQLRQPYQELAANVIAFPRTREARNVFHMDKLCQQSEILRGNCALEVNPIPDAPYQQNGEFWKN